jgi:hypothetical protein
MKSILTKVFAKANIIKTVACIAALIGLLMLVGDMPDAGLGEISVVKLGGLALLYAGSKIIDHYYPEEV